MENVIAWIDNIVAPKYFWIIELGVIFLLVLVLNQLSKITLNKLEIKAQKTKNTWDDAFIYACRIPIRFLGWLIGLNLVISIADGALPELVTQHLGLGNKLILLIFLLIFCNLFIKKSENNLIDQKFFTDPVDPTTVRAISKLLRASVLILVILTVMQLFDYSVSGLLAFGGIGGIAVGFAAKDLLANFFGGLMIYLDRPFSVGDWIR